MEKIDTGQRKVLIQCDMFGIIAAKAHYKMFKGPGAQEEAEVFLRTRSLQQRGYIEVVTELPRVVPALVAPPPVDENAELTRMADELITALRAKRSDDSAQLRRKLFALQRLLAGRLA